MDKGFFSKQLLRLKAPRLMGTESFWVFRRAKHVKKLTLIVFAERLKTHHLFVRT